MVDDINQLDLTKTYTYADYLTWQFEERVELIKGKVYLMPSNPGRLHQEILGNLFVGIRMNLKETSCQVYLAPFDVRLPSDQTNEEIDTVVQPDICVICDERKLDEKGCIGAPELIIEVLSQGNNKKEVKDKFALYEQNKVTHYWVVFPSVRVLQVYDLKNGKYVAQNHLTDGDYVQLPFLAGLSLSVTELFGNT